MIALIGVLGAAPAPAAIEIHVVPEAAVAADGTMAPTVPLALELLGERRANGETDVARIVIHDGRHEIAHPLEIDDELAGEGLIIEAAPGARPSISGGRAIEGLRACDDGTWRAVIEEVRDGAWWFEELFAGVEPRTRAREPDSGVVRVVEAGPDNRTSFTFDPAEIDAGLLDERAEVVFLHDWSISRVRIAGVDPVTSTITVADPIGCRAAHYAITNFEPNPRYFIEGGPALVDGPGEWALDRASGELIYRPLPGESIDDVSLIAPFAPALVRLTGAPDAPVSNVVLRDLELAHARWNIPASGYAEGQAAFHEPRDEADANGPRRPVPAAIDVAWAVDCLIENCTVTSVGGSGVWIGSGCASCEIVDCTVREAGANGVMIGDAASRRVEGGPWWQTAPDQVASGNRAIHCLVERCGRRFFGAVGVWIGLAEETSVAGCEVRDLPYTGISVGWRWDETPTPCRANVIEANDIHHVMRVLSDGGGIYTLGAIDTTPIRWHWTYANTVRDNTFVLGEGQRIAHYNRARPEDIDYVENRTPAAESWAAYEAAEIMRDAGPRR
jgi:hypothetical protein